MTNNESALLNFNLTSTSTMSPALTPSLPPTTPSTTFQFIIHNVQSLKSPTRFFEFSLFLQEICTTSTILFLTETRCPPNLFRFSLKKYALPLLSTKFTSFSTFDPSFPHGSGASILVPNFLTPFLSPPESYEGYVLSLQASLLPRKVVFICVYWPHPSTSSGTSASTTGPPTAHRCYNKILKFLKTKLQQAISNNLDIIVGGDFNQLHTSNDATPHHSLLNSPHSPLHTLLESFGLLDVFQLLHPTSNGFTRVTSNSSSRLDYMYATPSIAGRALSSFVISSLYPFSDHFPLISSILAPTWCNKKFFKDIIKAQKSAKRTVLDLKAASQNQIADFQAMFTSLITSRFNGSHIDLAWESFSKTLLQAAKTHLPQKIINNIPKSYQKSIKFKIDKLISRFRHFLHTSSPPTLSIFDLNLIPQKFISKLPPLPSNNWTKPLLKSFLLCFLGIRKKLIYQYLSSYKIKSSISFDANIFSSPRKGIQHALSRYPHSLDINFAMDGENPIYQPPEVLHALSLQGCALFPPGPSHITLQDLPLDWQPYYQPIPVPENTYTSLLSPPSKKEVLWAIKKSGKHKSPGPSQITYDLLLLSGYKGIKYIKKLLTLAFSSLTTPTSWKISLLYFIAKSDSPFNGSLSSARPICLLETAQKLMIRILFARLTTILQSHQLIKGANQSVFPNTSSFTPISALSTILNLCRNLKHPLYMFQEDKSKAYDSILYPILRLSLLRLSLPLDFIDFYIKSCLQGRSSHIITTYGLTAPFEYGRGIPQGGVESPLLWIIFYDPLIVRLQTECQGFSLYQQLPSFTYTYNQLATPGQSLVACSYVDDLIIFTPSKVAMQQCLDILHSFNTNFGISSNISKSHLLVLNDPIPDPPLNYNSDPIMPVAKSFVFRYLGVYFNGKGSFLPSIAKATTFLSSATSHLKSKFISIPRLRLLFQTVLFPALAYILQISFPSPQNCTKINQLIRNTFRHVYRLHRRTPCALFHSLHAFNIPVFEHYLLSHCFTNLQVGIHPSSPSSKYLIPFLASLTHDTLSYPFCLSNPLPILPPSSNHPLRHILPLMSAIQLSLPPPIKTVSQTFIPLPYEFLSDEKIADTLRQHEISDLSFLLDQSHQLISWETYARSTQVHPSAAPSSFYEYLSIQIRTWSPPATLPPTHQLTNVPLPPVHSFIWISGQVFYVSALITNTLAKPFVLVSHFIPFPSQSTWVPCNNKFCQYYKFSFSKKCRCRLQLPFFFTFIKYGPLPHKNVHIPIPTHLLAEDVTPNIPQTIVTHTNGLLPLSVYSLLNSFFGGFSISNTHAVWPPALQTITVWTDGSLEHIGSASVSSTCAIFFPSINASVTARVPLATISSSQIELWGIILALAACPSFSRVILFLDNKGITQKWTKNSNVQPRQCIRTSNPFEWSIIRGIISLRHISLTLKWTKGHSTDKYNCLVDNLASTAHSLPYLHIKQVIYDHIDCLFPHIDTILLNADPLKSLSHLLSLVPSLQFMFRVSFPLHPSKIFWPYKTSIFSPPSSFVESPLYRFQVRALLSLLPTQFIKYYYNNGLHPYCLLCPTPTLDTLEHAFCCPSSPDTNILLENFLHKYYSDQPILSLLVSNIIRTYWTTLPIHLLISGAHLNTTLALLPEQLFPTRKKKILFLRTLSSSLASFLFKNWWVPRIQQQQQLLQNPHLSPTFFPLPPPQPTGFCFLCYNRVSNIFCSCSPKDKLNFYNPFATVIFLSYLFNTHPKSSIFTNLSSLSASPIFPLFSPNFILKINPILGSMW